MLYTHTRAQPTVTAPRGITLLEVLIAMGILTVGLSSVALLIPAGRSQAVKASIYDRSSTLASNATADLVNRGFLRTEELVPNPSLANSRILIYDPLFSGAWGPTATFVNLRDDASTSAASTTQLAVTPRAGGTAISSVAADILFRSEDDPIYAVPDNDPDAPPMPGWSADTAAGTNGRRAFDGTYSYLATLETGELNPPFWISGRQATLTVVVFHRRDPSTPPLAFEAVNGLWVSPQDSAGNPAALPDGDTIRDTVQPGSMVLWTNPAATPPQYRWYRSLLVTDQSNPVDGVRMGISCEGSDPPLDNDGDASTPSPFRLYVLPGAVAGWQVPVALEGSSEWSE